MRSIHRTLPFLRVLLQTTVMAQPYDGTYVVPTSNGQITMTLQQSGDSVTGTLVDDQGTAYQLTAQLDQDGALAGELTSDNGMAAIGAMIEGDDLYVNLIPFDANGEPLYEAAINVALERTEVDGGPPESARPSTRDQGRTGRPLGPNQLRETFSGTFDGRLLGTKTTLSAGTVGGCVGAFRSARGLCQSAGLAE